MSFRKSEFQRFYAFQINNYDLRRLLNHFFGGLVTLPARAGRIKMWLLLVTRPRIHLVNLISLSRRILEVYFTESNAAVY